MFPSKKGGLFLYIKLWVFLDIDECEIRDGPHAHKCLVDKACQNYVGGYRCRCSILGERLKQISETQCEGNTLLFVLSLDRKRIKEITYSQ